jgi:hypothetical protein
METESSNKISFLDLNVTKEHDHLSTNIYRKQTFSGLGLSFFSISPMLHKINSIRTLIYRAYHLCSTYKAFSDELNFLRNFFDANGYPLHLFDNLVSKFLNNIYSPTLKTQTAAKKTIYFPIPYYNNHCQDSANKLKDSLKSFFPHLDIKFSQRNIFTIGSFFKIKDRIPGECISNVIYKFSCRGCNATYLGSTRQKSKVRFHQHLGTSHRTNRPLQTLMYSLPRLHSEKYNHPISLSDFSILDTSTESHTLQILENIYIKQTKPTLNIQTESNKLLIS